MNRILAVLVLATLLPQVSAALASEDDEAPAVVTTRSLRVGDRLVYDELVVLPDDDFQMRTLNVTALYAIEGQAEITDRYGSKRTAWAVRIERESGGELVHAIRCFSGPDLVSQRYDVLAGNAGPRSAGWSWTGLGLGVLSVYEERSASWENATSWFGDGGLCLGSWSFPETTFREGERLDLDALLGRDTGQASSDPMTATTFHGRPALVARFEGPAGADELTIADGLPGFVLWTRPDGNEHGLRAFEAGTGPVLTVVDDPPPAANPDVPFAPRDPLRFDDRALGLDPPFAEAYEAAAQDATFTAWMSGHPDAALWQAFYLPSSGETTGPGATWWFSYEDGGDFLSVSVERVDSAAVGLPTALLPMRTSVSTRSDEPRVRLDTARSATSEAVVALMASAGMETDIRSLSWSMDAFVLENGTIGGLEELRVSGPSMALDIDLLSGGLRAIYSRQATESSTFLSTGPTGGLGRADAPRTSAFAALALPTLGAGLGASTPEVVAGVTVLGLLVKFLVLPLYTRLTRARLLDHPVRARLLERIRAEPGVHRQDLVGFARCGDGATRHHLRQLAKHRLVVEVETPGFARYFAAGALPPALARDEAVLRDGSHRRVYDLYVTQPGLSLREAGARLDMSAPSVFRAKRALTKAGLLPLPPAASAQDPGSRG